MAPGGRNLAPAARTPLECAWRAPQEWATEALGAERVVRTDSGTPAAERHATIERFNAPDRCGARRMGPS
jgi:hypothetical protein